MVLDKMLDAGELIVLDGATGTAIPRFGGELDPVTWCGAANKHYPNAVRQVHEANLRAGADVITTNTFATCRHVLDGVGLGNEVVAINTAAVTLAKEARDAVAAPRSVAIAGSMSTMTAWIPDTFSTDRRFAPTAQQRDENYDEMAQALAGAGVDCLILEMIMDLDNGPALAKAAFATGLPVWIGLSCTRRSDGTLVGWDLQSEHPGELEPGQVYADPPTLDQLIDTFCTFDPQVIGIMHSQIDATAPAVARLKGRWRGPVMAYPETIGFEGDVRRGVSATPAAFAQRAVGLVEAGVQVIGGCCGTTIEHIEAMVAALPGRA